MLITEKKKIERFYEALITKDASFIGSFFVGVKTTSIFCISTCRAKKPKLKNVEFYTSFKEALDNGYRPCKICRPTENANDAPEMIQTAIDMVRKNPKDRITDYSLRTNNISPEVVRRWFNRNYGMTFQSFQRMYRINNAFEELKNGTSATHAAIDHGYESLSGFGYTFRKAIGKSPQQSLRTKVILINRLTSPLGPMWICATEKGICLLEFVDRRMLETEFKDLQRLLGANIIAGENDHIRQCKFEIDEYFEGNRKGFNVPLDPVGTKFQQSVWSALQDIKYGKTSTYQRQAELLNQPKAVRAIARANGFNRLSILVPCHRVVGKDGSLTGYGGGIERKRWLLGHEQKNI